MHVSHMKYTFLHVLVLHVYFETPPLEKENCGKLPSLGGGAWNTQTKTLSHDKSEQTLQTLILHGHMNTGSRAMHHTRPQVESKDADPNPPIKIHGPLANTFFLRAIHAPKKNLHI